jgi:hypothetical protein
MIIPPPPPHDNTIRFFPFLQNAPVQLESFANHHHHHYGYGGGDVADDWKKQQHQQQYHYTTTTTTTTTNPSSSSIMQRLSNGPCGCCSKPSTIYNADEGPNGRYYRDDFNDYSWTCNFGTSDEDGIWLNQADPAGSVMAMMVWILLGYSCLTITLVAQTGGIPAYQSFFYTILIVMALSCHVKTSLTDPGSVPAAAVPTEEQRKNDRLSMCSQCQTFKPPLSHHCRICNRCISRMDRKFLYYYFHFANSFRYSNPFFAGFLQTIVHG